MTLCLYDTPVREGKVAPHVYEQENGENIFPDVFLMFGNWLEAFGFFRGDKWHHGHCLLCLDLCTANTFWVLKGVLGK